MPITYLDEPQAKRKITYLDENALSTPPASSSMSRFTLKSSQPYTSYSYGDAFKDTGKTIVNSLADLGEGIRKPFEHPVQAAKELAQNAIHPIQTVKGFGQHVYDRYGSEEKFAKTVATDPFGFGSDVIGAVGAGAGVKSLLKQGVKKVGKVIAERPAKLATEATNEYRTMLRPTQGEVKNVEIRQGRNINDYYRLAAEEELPISQTPDKKLDTSVAREKLVPKQEQLHQFLNNELASNPSKQFDLIKIRNQAKQELRKTIKNDTEFKNAAMTVDEQISDAIAARGRMVDGPELNNLKQGMWSVGYDQLKPTSQMIARKIGHIAKESIEKAYPNAKIRQLNDLSGKYATLNTLLENAQGRVVKGGRLGGYFARTVGAIAGAKGGPLGSIAGQEIGAKVADFIYAPERASKAASSKARKANISEQSFKNAMAQPMVRNAEVLRDMPVNNNPKIGYKSPEELNNLPFNFPQQPQSGPGLPLKPSGQPGAVMQGEPIDRFTMKVGKSSPGKINKQFKSNRPTQQFSSNPADIIEKNLHDIPIFKGTGPAEKFGEKATPSQIKALQAEQVSLQKQAEKLLADGKDDEYMALVSGQKQFVNEALKTAKKHGRMDLEEVKGQGIVISDEALAKSPVTKENWKEYLKKGMASKDISMADFIRAKQFQYQSIGKTLTKQHGMDLYNSHVVLAKKRIQGR